jgi:6-pyruvoyltetrahydropterin/6-carboxytetrahydropterin synthase
MLIRKTFKFEAAHRLRHSYTKRCRGVHGHSYKVEIILEGAVSEHDGMVLDFTMLKEKVGKYIDKFDHSLIVSEDDKLADPEKLALIDFLNPRFVIVPYEPTAEMMPAHFFFICTTRGLPVHSVRVHETESGYAECTSLNDELFEVKFGETRFSAAIEMGE